MLFTFDGRSKLLQHLFTPDDPLVTPLGMLWLALVNAPVQPADDGESISELVAASYTRQGIAAQLQFWTLTGNGMISNAAPVYWSAAKEDWGLVSGWALCTAAQGGLAIAGGNFLDSLQVLFGDLVALAPGMLVLEIA